MEIQTFSSLLFLEVSHQDYEIQVSQHLSFPVTETFTMSHGFSWSILGGGMTRDGTGRVREYTHKASTLHPFPIPTFQRNREGESDLQPQPRQLSAFVLFCQGRKRKKKN